MLEYRFQLTPLTPIHIGSGETLEPFEYVILGDTLHRFALDELMLALPRDAQAQFVDVVEQSVSATRRFVSEHAATAAQVARWIADVTSAVSTLSSEQMADGEAYPEIQTCIRTGERPYIPGSSLKGALRTALLYHAMKQNDSGERNSRHLEQRVFGFGKIQEDPFRAFKVGDGKPLADRTRVQRVDVRVRRDWGWSEKLSVLVETVPGALSDSLEQVSEHTITLDQDFFRYHARAYALSAERVLAACRDFYGTHLETERRAIRDLPAGAAAYEALARHAEALPDHACLVRLAWGSGRDATTVVYKLRGKPPARSRRLTASGFPLGWAELAILDAKGEPVGVEKASPTVSKPLEQLSQVASVSRLRDLREGMVLEGTIVDVFGPDAVVNVGVERPGTMEKSAMGGRIVRRGDRVRVEVISVELERNRFGLRLMEVIR